MSVRRVDVLSDIKDKGLSIIDLDEFNDYPFEVTEKAIINFAPGQVGGNHSHSRWEAFIAIGSGLTIVWQEENGLRKESLMNPGGQYFIYLVPPGTPHAVINKSETEKGILLEFASGPQKEVKPADLV